MLKIIASLILIVSLLISVTACDSNSEVLENGQNGNSTGVKWLYDWDEALQLAQSNNMPIMVNFYTQVCPYCVKLDQYVFANQEVSDFLNDNFICVKSDAGKSNPASYYYMTGVPTTYFTKPDGTSIGYVPGYVPPETFLMGSQKAFDLWLNELEGDN